MHQSRILILLVLLLTGCGQPKQTLNILTFPDFIDPSVVEHFEREHDCKVVFDFMDSGDALAGKLGAGGATAYDIVCMAEITSASRQGLLAPLRGETIPNIKNIDPRFDVLSFDAGVRYSVPYLWGSTGLYLRSAPGKAVEDTWGLIFDKSKQHGSYFLLNESRTCIGAALRFRGFSVNSTNSAELAEARELLIEAKQRSLGFIDGTSVKNRILGRDGEVAMAWSGSAAGQREDRETTFVVPREGAVMLLDGFCILAKAPHRELAEKFLNNILDPKVGAQIANFLHYPTANRAALQFILPDDLYNPTIYPPPEVVARLEPVRELGAFSKLYDEIWTQVKSK